MTENNGFNTVCYHFLLTLRMSLMHIPTLHFVFYLLLVDILFLNVAFSFLKRIYILFNLDEH